MALFIEERGGTVRPDYEAPNLFPESGKYQNPEHLRRYVTKRLMEMVADNTLSVTDLHNQVSRCREMAGMVILGQRIDPDSKMMMHDEPPPMELMMHEIKIKAIGGVPIKYKKGRKPRGQMIGAARRTGEGDNYSEVEQKERHEDVWMVSDKQEASVPLMEAWRILHQYGKYCRPASRAALQKKYWLYEEQAPKKRKAKPRNFNEA